ncbi:DNA mismatch endonuclease Vsr [Nakamurella sp. YIM 132087]|uniref:DNA mismatch endonuclease Vsr n=1 Tax=Nakamurella alba TaxID=2665158 RepID=A0A7K1FLU9_9ACTN|nr:very short patch repair endonuclease [Nakamurella alba]MTD15137.1 DNA mismatch endonuclease Vsr [Nakamurella alba]
MTSETLAATEKVAGPATNAPDDSAEAKGYVTSAARSRNMAAIRRSDTKPEVLVRSELHRRGFRYRKDFLLEMGSVRPRPDIVFTRLKVAVFIDGCFWHLCPDHSKIPRNNTDYWEQKLLGNVARDLKYDHALSGAGWLVVRCWEHEAVDSVVGKIESVLFAAVGGRR